MHHQYHRRWNFTTMSLSSRSLKSIFSNENDRNLFVDCLRRSKTVQTEGPPDVIDIPNVEYGLVVDGPSIISQDSWSPEVASISNNTDIYAQSSARTSASTTTTGADATSIWEQTEASSGIDRNSTVLPPPIPSCPLHFPAKLHYLLSQPNNNHILSWSDDGKSLMIKDVDLFEQELLHECFAEMKHFRSFQKQLQRYKFKAVCSTLTGASKKCICYARENFERHSPDACDDIYKEYVKKSKRKREEKKRMAKATPK